MRGLASQSARWLGAGVLTIAVASSLAACSEGASDDELRQIYGAQSCEQLFSAMQGVETLFYAEVISKRAADELFDAGYERADELNCIFE